MRILYDSFREEYKSPFGVVTAGEDCIIHIDVPTSCLVQEALVVVQRDAGGEELTFPLTQNGGHDGYDRFGGAVRLTEPGLYFYWFFLRTQGEGFCLYRRGLHDTNMEQGDRWQLSCLPEKMSVPQWARGAVMYQIFPDRFFREGVCDCTGKLQPYIVHASEEEPPCWKPNERGEVLNHDFYGGNLRGIAAKLEHLQSLGVELIYLNPIFKAYSSHRYDTCDYLTVDPMLGTEEDFVFLCRQVHRRGMRLILDGVFSHTGSRSLYFDREGEFGGGAYGHPESPYRSWYLFSGDGSSYTSWWDFPTLPTLDKRNAGCREFLCSVVRKWMRLGADGFRLDVADELPDDFIAELRKAVRETKPDGLLIGEVWEDASSKIAYSVRRRYFTAPELDGVMNYPWKDALLGFASGAVSGTELAARLETLTENYPPEALQCTMLPLSTHDSPRALTALVAPLDGSREEMAAHRLSPEQRALALRRLRFAAVAQFVLPGMPSVYYGDEAGMEGCKDPFNRGFFPWAHADGELTAFFRRLGMWRRNSEILRRGTLSVVQSGQSCITLRRTLEKKSITVCLNSAELSWRVDGDEVIL